MAYKIVKEPEKVEEIVEKKIEKKEVYKVVAKLPTQEVRRYQEEDGTIVNLITIEEALTGIVNG